MANQKKRVQEIINIRNEQMARDICIVKESGLEGLQEEYRRRNLVPVPVEWPTKAINEVMYDISKRVANCYGVAVCKVLNETFGFGKIRLHRFEDDLKNVIEDLKTIDGYGEMLYTFRDLAEHYNKKYEMDYDIDSVDIGDESNQHALGAGKVDISYVAETLRRHEYFEAAQLLEDIMGV